MEHHLTIVHKVKQIAHTYFPGNTKLTTRGCMCWAILYSGKYGSEKTKTTSYTDSVMIELSNL